MEKQEYSDEYLLSLGLTRKHLTLATEILEHFEGLYNPETDGDKNQYIKNKLTDWFHEVNKEILYHKTRNKSE